MLISKHPSIAEHSEPMSTAIFPISRSCCVVFSSSSLNDSVSTKIDIVNPIPPKHATANSILHVEFAGISPNFSLMAKKLAEVIPIGLPNNSPKNTPMLTLPISGEIWKILKKLESGITTPALARANIGIMK